MLDPTTGPVRNAGFSDELAGILRDCAQWVPGSGRRLLAWYDKHLRAHVGSTPARVAVGGPALRAALAAACAGAAEFDPARESAEAWLAARLRRARVPATLIPFPARTDRRADEEPSNPEAVPALPAAALRPQESRRRVVGRQGDVGVAEPPGPAAPDGSGEDGEPGPAAPASDAEVGNGTSALRGGGAGREDAGTHRAAPAGEEVGHRWAANYQRAEIRSLEARVQELERRLRQRTVALLAALAVGVCGGTLGDAFLAVKASLEPRAPAIRIAGGPGGTAGAVSSGAPPGPGTESGSHPEFPAALATGPLSPPEAGSSPRAETSRVGEQPAAAAPGRPAGPAGLGRLGAEAPETKVANRPAGADPDREPRPDRVTRPAGGATAGTATPQSLPDGMRVEDGGGTSAAATPEATAGQAVGAAAHGPRGEVEGGRTEAPPQTPPVEPTPAGKGAGEGSGTVTAAPPAREAGEAAGSAPFRTPAPPAAAAVPGPPVPPLPASDVAPRPAAAVPSVPLGGSARDGWTNRGTAGGSPGAEALRAALAATKRSLEGPGAAGGGDTPPFQKPGPRPR